MNRSAATTCYQAGSLTIQVAADLPISEGTFYPPIQQFRTTPPPEIDAAIHHHFSLPDLTDLRTGAPLYQNPPWAIYANDQSYIYVGISADPLSPEVHQAAVFTRDHRAGEIYHPGAQRFLQGGNRSITLFPTDQIFLGRLLADRQGCIFHAAGMVLNDRGLLFAGHSGAGKSTLVTMLKDRGLILCDDRNIARRLPEGWRLYGTWSHGDVPDVSPASAPLRAIIFLEQAPENRLIALDDRREIARRLPFYVIKPLVTADWWEKTLDLLALATREVPVYRLRFDKSGAVFDALAPLLE